MNIRTIAITLTLSVFALCPGMPAHAAKRPKPAKPAAKITKQQSEAKQAKAADPGSADDTVKFHLKPDAKQKVCLGCHVDIQDKLKKAFVHTPVKSPGCTACHSPHTTNYPKQLWADPSVLCLGCHKTIIPDGARSTHKVVVEGKCVLCHDPHSADNKFNLRTAGNELCFGCHKDKAESVPKAKFQHHPVEKSCLNCHNPHASKDASFLLSNDVPALCTGCHQTDKQIFISRHMNYPVGNSRCTMCHNAHGSDRPALIYNNVHPPFANKSCNLCHEDANSPTPLALRKKGFDLCRGCHNSMINDMFSKKKLHLAVVGKDSCLGCHSPHASPEKGMLKDKPIKLCGRCHEDTIQRQERSITKHEPIQDGKCVVCHSPHASDQELLFQKPTVIDLCGQCHDWQKHSTHPVGEKIIDKRNKNLTVQCLSCHRAHGTEFKHMIPTETVTALCTECHVNFRR